MVNFVYNYCKDGEYPEQVKDIFKAKEIINYLKKEDGYFLTEEEAKQAYLEAKRLYHYN
jgi:hypothetical protein